MNSKIKILNKNIYYKKVLTIFPIGIILILQNTLQESKKGGVRIEN